MKRIVLVLIIAGYLSGCDRTQNPVSKSIQGRTQEAHNIVEDSPEKAIADHGFPQILKWAEEGDPKAQHFVAMAYLTNIGVPKSFVDAERWALRAANQGSPASQYLVGMIRKDAAIGRPLKELEPNLVRAYAWFSLAAAAGNKPAKNELEEAERALDAKSVNQAQRLAASWRPCHELACWDQGL